MFSLTGIPPLAGFFGKWYAFQAAMSAGLWPLVDAGGAVEPSQGRDVEVPAVVERQRRLGKACVEVGLLARTSRRIRPLARYRP